LIMSGVPAGIGDSSQFNSLFAGGGVPEGAGGGETPSELEDVLATLLVDSPEGAVYRIYKNRNLLLVKNTRENLRLVEMLMEEFDKPILQVLIEARFITISQKDLYEIGFDIPEFTPENPDDEKTVKVIDNDLLPNFPDDGGNLALSGIIDRFKYRAVIRALDEKSSTKTISSPRVTVLNNHVAMIRRGDTLRYYEEYELETIPNENGVAVSQPVPTGDVQELDLGINFYVKPTIGSDSEHVMLSLRPYIADFLGYETFETAKLPKTNENNIETTVVVRSGETVILGGMITNNKQQDHNSIPIINQIPFIGELLGNKNQHTQPLHLIVFVTATIVNSSGEYVKIKRDNP